MRQAILQLDTGDRIALDLIHLIRENNEVKIVARSLNGCFDYSNWLQAQIRKKTEPEIKDVIFNDPATIVIWSDGTKTVVKCSENDTYNKEVGLAMCIAKKYFGNKGNYNDVFHKFIKED